MGTVLIKRTQPAGKRWRKWWICYSREAPEMKGSGDRGETGTCVWPWAYSGTSGMGKIPFLSCGRRRAKCLKKVRLNFKGLSSCGSHGMTFFYSSPRCHPLWRKPYKLLASWENKCSFLFCILHSALYKVLYIIYAHSIITEWMNEWTNYLRIFFTPWIWNSWIMASTWQSLGASDCSLCFQSFPQYSCVTDEGLTLAR